MVFCLMELFFKSIFMLLVKLALPALEITVSKPKIKILLLSKYSLYPLSDTTTHNESA